MPDPSTVLLIVSFAYAAAVIGLMAALAGRAWACRSGRLPTVQEAAWCAFLPAVAVLLLPLSTLQPHPSDTLAVMHDWWHEWERAIHSTPVAHGSLHAANSLLLLVALVGIGRATYTLARMRAFVTEIHAAATPEGASLDGIPLFSLATPKLLCFTIGVLRPAIYASTSLRQSFTPRDCQAMLAHEAAHVRRRDNLIRIVLVGFYALFPLPGSHRLLAEWLRAAERECDAAAARHIGSTTDVASALIRVAQASARVGASLPAGASFAAFDDDIEGRVRALLAPAASRSQRQPVFLILMGVGFLLMSSVWLYHVVDLFVRH